jgi:hypothetical protein
MSEATILILFLVMFFGPCLLASRIDLNCGKPE